MRVINLMIVLGCWCLPIALFAQTAGLDESVIVLADARESPPSIKLRWYLTLQCQGFRVSRKLKSETSFVQVSPNVPPNQNFWIDTTVVPGVEYEYKVHRFGGNSPWTGSNGYGYISAGIRVEPNEHKGRIILVLDSTLVTNPAMKNPIWQWQQDAAGDGWTVETVPVSLNATPAEVKHRIRNVYEQFNHDVRSVFLLGHVPIPYSGMINPDGHGDHLGAWPADGYYGEMDGVWTDATVSINSPDLRNRNLPGDGKFDQSVFPGAVDLEVGRVDVRNLPMFNMTEAAQIRRYLTKNHRFRTHLISVVDRAMHDDQATGLNFGATAWRGFTSLCRNINIPSSEYGGIGTGNFRSTLTQNDYMWSGSWGPGSYSSVGTNQNSAFVTDSFRTVFTSFIGSYFGDWDNPANNFMRAALSNKGPILTTCWSGRPFWYFHHMGMGECIGYAARLTMNNETLYPEGSRARQVHIALLGDPTLRQHPMGQPKNFSAVLENNRVKLKWQPPNDTLNGYFVYKKEGDRFRRIHEGMISDTTFQDSCLTAGEAVYMVRCRRLEGARTGTYWNLSTGVMDTVSIGTQPQPAVEILSGSSSYCPTDTAYIQSVIGGAFSPAYQWFRNNTQVPGATDQVLMVATPINLDAYRLRVTSISSCGNSDTVFSNQVVLSVDTGISPTLSLTSDIPIGGMCEGKPATFKTNATGTGSSPAYAWYRNQTLVGTDTNLTINNLADHDTIRVRLTSNALCAFPNPVSATWIALVNPTPESSFSVSDSLLTVVNPAGLSYQWFLNSNPVPGATDSTLLATATGFYSVSTTNSFGCADTSLSVFVSVTGLKKGHSVAFPVYPNPFENAFTIQLPGAQKPEIVEVTDLHGKSILLLHPSEPSLRINTTTWKSGNYFLKVQGARQVFWQMLNRL